VVELPSTQSESQDNVLAMDAINSTSIDQVCGLQVVQDVVHSVEATTCYASLMGLDRC
jgi:hypothetical protein